MMGSYNGSPKINPEEVADFKWMKPEDIQKDIAENPEQYTVWFKIIFEKFFDHLIHNMTHES